MQSRALTATRWLDRMGEGAISCRRLSDARSGMPMRSAAISDADDGGLEFGANVDRSVISKWPVFLFTHT